MPTDLTETGGGFDVVQAYMDHVKRIDPSLANEDFSDLISAHRRLSEQANGRTALALEGSTVLCVTEDIPFLVDRDQGPRLCRHPAVSPGDRR